MMSDKVCKNNHTFTGKKCVQCRKEYADSYYKKNREKIKIRQAKYREGNLEKVREMSRNSRAKHLERCKKSEARWYKDNKERKRQAGLKWVANNYERFKEKQKSWYKQNLDKYASYSAKRRSVKLKATPPWLTEEHFELIFSFYQEAKRLQSIDGIERQVDHIMPLIHEDLCGLHVPWNLQVLTAVENNKKGNKL